MNGTNLCPVGILEVEIDVVTRGENMTVVCTLVHLLLLWSFPVETVIAPKNTPFSCRSLSVVALETTPFSVFALCRSRYFSFQGLLSWVMLKLKRRVTVAVVTGSPKRFLNAPLIPRLLAASDVVFIYFSAVRGS